MGIQIMSVDGQTTAEVDPGHLAQRVTVRPMRVNSWQSIAAMTGAVTGLAAGAPVFSLRNTGTGVLLVRRVQVQFVLTTAFTAAQRLELALYVARAWTVADSGGLPMSIASGKHRTAMTTPAIEARIATTSALTAGTRTLDAHPLGIAALYAGGAGATLALTSLLSHDAGDHPLVLGNQEGFLVSNLLTMGATGAGFAYMNVEFAEASSF